MFWRVPVRLGLVSFHASIIARKVEHMIGQKLLDGLLVLLIVDIFHEDVAIIVDWLSLCLVVRWHSTLRSGTALFHARGIWVELATLAMNHELVHQIVMDFFFVARILVGNLGRNDPIDISGSDRFVIFGHGDEKMNVWKASFLELNNAHIGHTPA